MLHVLSLPVLAPFLLWQGKRVRATTLRLPEPQGQRQGIAGQGEPLRVLIIGDSSAAGVGAEHQHQALAVQLAVELGQHYQVHWQLHAKSGANTSDALAMLTQLSAQPFDLVITVLGVNDVTSRLGVNDWLVQQQRLHAQLARQFDHPHIIACGLPPMGDFPALPQPLRWYLGRRAEQFEKALKRSIKNKPRLSFFALDFCDDVSLMAEDGFHPGPGAYSQWANELARTVSQTVISSRSG